MAAVVAVCCQKEHWKESLGSCSCRHQFAVCHIKEAWSDGLSSQAPPVESFMVLRGKVGETEGTEGR